MPQRFVRKSIEELKDFMGFVSLCVPDMFPDDEDAELGPKNLDEAFEDIYAAVEYIKANDTETRAKLESLIPLVAKAQRFSNAKNYKECIVALDEFRESL